MGTLQRRAVKGLRAGDRQGVCSATLHLLAITSVIPSPLPHQHPTLSTPPALTASPPLLQGNPACTQTPETLQPLSPRQGHGQPPALGPGPPGRTHLRYLVLCMCPCQHSPRIPPPLPARSTSRLPARPAGHTAAGRAPEHPVPGLPRRAALPVPVVASRCQSTGREQAATGR